MMSKSVNVFSVSKQKVFKCFRKYYPEHSISPTDTAGWRDSIFTQIKNIQQEVYVLKTRLAVYIGDEEYQHRFVRCLINHYQSQFEVHAFTDESELQTWDMQECEVLLLGDCKKNVLENLSKSGACVLYLKDDKEELFETEQIVFVEKYQEVYKIVESIEKVTGTHLQNGKKQEETEKKPQVIGVFSLMQEKLQLPFAAALSSICGEKKSVLLLDLQAFSGLSAVVEAEKEAEILGLEDLMAAAATQVYTKGRLLAGIGKTDYFSYVHGVKNPECLAEGNIEIYNTMLNILTKELGYNCIVINFGSVFSGMLELLDSCNTCFFLVEKDKTVKWREDYFQEVMQKRGKKDFLCRVKKFEISAIYSTDIGWQQLAQKWHWNEVGDALRQMLWEKNDIGGEEKQYCQANEGRYHRRTVM